MRLFVSLTAPGSGRDLVLDAPGTTTVGALAAQLAGTGDDGAEPPVLHLGDVPLPPGATLSAAGLRDGVRLGLGVPAAPEDTAYGAPRGELPPPSRTPDGERLPRAAGVELQLVGGRGAGRVWPLAPGTHAVGPHPGSSVRLEGRDVPPAGVRVTVRPDGTVLLHTGEQGAHAALSLPVPPPARPRADAAPLPPA
ncbi:FtsK/SpoIIIE domain-containing protein, partial [Streptomyces nondiastaticus]